MLYLELFLLYQKACVASSAHLKPERVIADPILICAQSVCMGNHAWGSLKAILCGSGARCERRNIYCMSPFCSCSHNRRMCLTHESASNGPHELLQVRSVCMGNPYLRVETTPFVAPQRTNLCVALQSLEGKILCTVSFVLYRLYRMLGNKKTHVNIATCKLFSYFFEDA